ncbi:Glycine receptor subunit alpha-2 [Lamellibrachia satsuma]|nr:Glycine receptor subunit alpha-2 [Lamellibrachia satsuma]
MPFAPRHRLGSPTCVIEYLTVSHSRLLNDLLQISTRDAAVYNRHGKFRCDYVSDAFTTDTVKLIWAKEKPLTIPKLLRMQQFYLADNGTIDCTYQALYISGKFPCLRVKLSLKRYIAFYLMSTYVPTAFIVVLSWLSFWLDSDAVPGRVTLGVTTVLTMMTQSYISSQSLPKVPYVKALDVWMATCMAFVFAAIMEFGLVNVQRRKEQDEFMRRARALGHDTNSQMSHVGIFTNVYLLGHRNADKIDAASRVIFPVIFVVFLPCRVTSWWKARRWSGGGVAVEWRWSGGGVAVSYKSGLTLKTTSTRGRYSHLEHSDYYITTPGVTLLTVE